MPVDVAQLTVNGMEMDDKTPLNNNEVTTQKQEDVLNMFKTNKPIFVKFYANWCGHCVSMNKDWKDLVKEIRNADMDFAFVSIESKAITRKIQKLISTIKGLGKVEGFPTIGLVQNKTFTSYDGARTKKGMLDFLKTNGLKNVPNANNAKTTTINMGGGGKRKRKTAKRKTAKRKTAKRKTIWT